MADKKSSGPQAPSTIKFDEFTEAVTEAVLRAIASHVRLDPEPSPWRRPRIIIGIIAEPQLSAEAEER